MPKSKTYNRYEQYYEWLEDNLIPFFILAGVTTENNGIITCHGDKTRQYWEIWEEAGINHLHGSALLLLGYCLPYSSEMRDTTNGWVAPHEWVITNYEKFKSILPEVIDLVDLGDDL